jgi:hypothetical protein
VKKEMTKEKPKSMFEKKPMETEHEAALGADHPEQDATGSPVHPQLQALMSKLEEPEEEPLMPHKVMGIKKK